ncbi:MAG: SprB repeat-containing protein, partial [Bacteroidales bacterium]|nr:SprB repeat-containing protein [Bacteroidales bacterium]MBN2820830.1 SprB repeat-containing protein [Bacteroidales bacterium]
MKSIARYIKLLTIVGGLVLSASSFGQFKIDSIVGKPVACQVGYGQLIVYTSGGGPAYNYFLYDNNPFNPPPAANLLGDPILDSSEDTAVFNHLLPGNYYIIATDNGTGGLDGLNANLASGLVKALTIDSTGVVSGPTCINSNDAELGVYVTGGNKPYTFLWSGGDADGQTNSVATGLGEGTYQVFVNDQNNCGDSITGNPRTFFFYKAVPAYAPYFPDSLNGGEINGDQAICEGEIPAMLGNDVLPSGGAESDGYTYTWEYQENCSGGWTTIVGATNSTLTFLATIPNTRCYRRVVHNTCGINYSDIATVTVNPLPAVTLAAFDDVCSNVPPYALSGGTPVGGTYSGDGVQVDGITFDAAAAGNGNHTITYTYTDGNGCSASDNENLRVLNAPNVSLGVFPDVCEDEPAFALSGGSPAGGTYKINGIPAVNFNPAAEGIGTHTILYTFIAANTCTDSASQPQVVNPVPTGTIGDEERCGDGNVTFTAVPTNGTRVEYSLNGG